MENGGEQGVVRGTSNSNPLTPERHEPERFESKRRKNKTGGNQHKKGFAIGHLCFLFCCGAAATD